MLFLYYYRYCHYYCIMYIIFTNCFLVNRWYSNAGFILSKEYFDYFCSSFHNVETDELDASLIYLKIFLSTVAFFSFVPIRIGVYANYINHNSVIRERKLFSCIYIKKRKKKRCKLYTFF